MTNEQFWAIVEETHDKSVSANEEKLFRRLCALTEPEIIAFDRIWTGYYHQLYSSLLWGVAYLAQGGCSDDGFMDWRNWVISCGRKAFETASTRPDDLVPLIDSEPDAGCEGIVYVIDKALRTKNPAWKDASPEHDLPDAPDEPTGPDWRAEEDLLPLLPKTYARYIGNANPAEKQRRDPKWVESAFGVTLGESEEFEVTVEEVEIDGQKGRKVKLAPAAKKPWWKFW